jgi:hypothetical protein
MIVARHEVPGFMRKIARPSGTVERISILIGRLDANIPFNRNTWGF